MKITWHGHSCFSIDTEDGTVVLDPYQDGAVPGMPPLRLQADLVLCSHEHHDHNARSAVTLSGKACGVSVETIPSWHDDTEGSKRGSNSIHVLSAESLRIAHLGDLGCMLTEDQTARLRGLDALLIPVGGYYTIDSEQALEIVRQLQPRVVIPMHYRFGSVGYDVISTIDLFRAKAPNPVDYSVNCLILTSDTKPQTAFLHL